MQPTNISLHSPEELQAQMPVRYGRMRFSDDLEADFRKEYSAQAARGRLWILWVPLVLFAVAAIWGPEMYTTPPELAAIFTPINGVVALLLGLTAFAHHARVQSRYVEAMMMGTGAAVGIWMTVSGLMAAHAGMVIPDGLGILYLVGMLVIARVPYRRAIVATMLTVAVVIAMQIFLGGYSGTLRLRYLEQILQLAIGAGAGYLLEFYSRRIWLQVRILECLSRTDPLTGMNNRRGVDEALALTLRHAAREHRPMTLLVLDLDFFKGLNDHHGHDYGDMALQKTAKFILTKTRRPLDVCGRMGGEEFVIALFDCDSIGAKARCQVIVEELEALGIENLGSKVSRHVTVSVGAASFWPAQGMSVADVLRKADENLYQAKHDGRNRYVLTQYKPESATSSAPDNVRSVA